MGFPTAVLLLIGTIFFALSAIKSQIMQNNETILTGYSDAEKGAYITAIASIATADHEASPQEMQYIQMLSDAAQLSNVQKDQVMHAAKDMSGEDLNHALDILKGSELKHSLVTDLMAFAKADNSYSEAEQHNIQRISQYLGLDQQQFSLLQQFTERAATTTVPAEQAAETGIFGSLGLSDKMRRAGINSSSLLKGIIGIAAPLLLSRMFAGRRTPNTPADGSSTLGKLGGLLGMGSLIGMLAGGRKMGSLGDMFKRTLGSRNLAW